MRRVRNVWRRRRQKVAPENRTHPVRHRDAWTRSRDRFRRRPKTPAPKSGWILAELAKLADVPATTVRYYVVQRLLRPIEFRGTVTRYARRDLLTLLGIARLKTEGKSTLVDKKKRLEALSDEELERWIYSGPVPPAAAAALGIQVATLPAAPIGATDSVSASASPTFGRTLVEFWQRIALLPGLDLMIRADANDVVRSVVQRICDEYLMSKGP